MQCKDIAVWLDAFRTSEIDPARAFEIRQHLEACESCAREAAFIEQIARDARAAARPVRPAVADRYGAIDTDLGRVWIAFGMAGITFLHLAAGSAAEFEGFYRRRIRRATRPGEVPARYADMVREAVAGSLRRGAAPVDISRLAPFEQRVLGALQTIPAGEVRTYAWLAREAGRPSAVRAAGNAMARNPVPLLLPCHRAVPSPGGTGNYAFGSDLKRRLLSREGVPLDELDELAQSGIRYIGCRSTHIFCFPTCRAARRIHAPNRVKLAGAAAATAAGYRPCKLCRPV